MGMNEAWSDYDDDEDEDFEDVILVTDLEVFVVSLREAVSASVAKGAIADKDLGEYVSVGQLKSLIESYIEGVDEESGHPFMREETYLALLNEASSVFLGACLSKLAAADLVDTAWDDERGQQVFWVKENRDV